MKPSTALIRELAELAPLFDRLRADGLRRRNLTLPRRRLLMFLHESGRLRSSELLTDSGVEICSDMQKSFDSFAAQLFAGISPDDIEATVKTIAVIRKNFEQMLAP